MLTSVVVMQCIQQAQHSKEVLTKITMGHTDRYNRNARCSLLVTNRSLCFSSSVFPSSSFVSTCGIVTDSRQIQCIPCHTNPYWHTGTKCWQP